jgi:hypothetical protein
VPTTTALCQDADDYAKRLPADIDAGRDDMNDPAEEAARESAERVGIGTAAGFDLYNASLQANAEWSSMPLRLVSVDRTGSNYLKRFVTSEIAKWAVPVKASGVLVD